jgi:hypothetical protein
MDHVTEPHEGSWQDIYASIFSADDFHTDATGAYRFDRSLSAAAHAKCNDDAFQALAAGRDAVVCNVFADPRRMHMEYLDPALAQGYGTQVLCMTQLFENVHGVPLDDVKRMAANFAPHPGEVYCSTPAHNAVRGLT